MNKTKKEFAEFAKKRGFIARYSGKRKKFFLKNTGYGMNVHALINAKQDIE